MPSVSDLAAQEEHPMKPRAWDANDLSALAYPTRIEFEINDASADRVLFTQLSRPEAEALRDFLNEVLG